MNEELIEIVEKLKLKKEKQDEITLKYKNKEKIKELTDKERIERIEEILNL